MSAETSARDARRGRAAGFADLVRRYGATPLSLSLGASVLIQVLAVITGILLARVLGPEDRGELAAVILWPTVLMMVGSLGVIEAVTFHTARRTAPQPTLIGTMLGLAALQSGAMLAIGFGIVPLVFGDRADEVETAAFIYLAVIPLGLPSLYVMAFLNGEPRFGWFSALRVALVAAQALGLIALAVAGELTIINAVLVYLGGVAITGVAAAVVAIRDAGGIGRWRASVAGALFGFGWRSQVSSVSHLLNERLDQLVISVFLSPAKLGLYVVAWTMTSFTGVIGYSVALVALPAVAGRENDAERAADARRFVSLTLVASVLIVAPLVALAPTIIDLAFGSSFQDASGVARVLLVASVALAVARVLQAVLKGINLPLQAGIAEGIALAVTAVGLAALLPTMGISGAAVASLLAYCTSAGYSLHRVSRELPVGAFEMLVPGRGTAGALRTVLGRWREGPPSQPLG